jgi:hypothetical protein
MIKLLVFFLTLTVFITANAEESSKSVGHQSTATSNTEDPAVKKSLSNVCYPKSHIGYKKTSKFTPYNSMNDCRNSGGRPPKAPKHG